VTKGLRTAQGGCADAPTSSSRNSGSRRSPRCSDRFHSNKLSCATKTVSRAIDRAERPPPTSARANCRSSPDSVAPQNANFQTPKSAEVETEGDLDETSDDSAASNEENDSDDDSVGSQVKETEIWKSATDVPDDVLDAAHRVHSRRWSPKSRWVGSMRFECALKAMASFTSA